MNFKKCFPCCPESFRTRATPAIINEETITETPYDLKKAIETLQALIIQKNKRKNEPTFELSYYLDLLKQIKDLLNDSQTLEDNNSHNIQMNKENRILNVYPELFFSVEELIDNYTIIKHLDKGQFSNVFLARVICQKKKNKLYAIKITKNYQRPTGDYMIKEHNVARHSDKTLFITKHIDHHEGKLYSFHVMEFLAGGNLAFHLERLKKFSEEQVKFISAEIICGLLVLHKEKIIHCDIKAENILFDLNGHLKIADFDQCRILMPYRFRKFGKPLKKIPFDGILSEYSAPECLQSADIDCSLDFWSLGILVYKMLTGDFPFPDNNSILNNDVPIMSNSSEPANNFVHDLLVKDQNERLGSENTYERIKKHKFYSGIDWLKLNNGELEPLFKPNESSSANFCHEIKKFNSKNFLTLTSDNYYDYLSNEFKEVTISEVKSIEFTKLLSEGSFGKIYLGRLEQSNNRVYAIKSLNKSANKKLLSEGIKILEMNLIEREIGFLGHQSRFITKLYAVFNSPTHLLYFMEYLGGGNLNEFLLENKMLPENVASFYTAEIVCGLEFLHSHSIIHRDIKLDNILLDFNGHSKLCDFGVCKRISQYGQTGTIMGTNTYFPPEIINEFDYNYSVDWWCLGICNFLMLTGAVPFETENDTLNNEMPDLNLSRVKKEAELQISPVACLFVSKLLEKDRLKRLGSNGQNVREDPYFRGIDWVKLEMGELAPPVEPFLDEISECSYFSYGDLDLHSILGLEPSEEIFLQVSTDQSETASNKTYSVN